MLNVYEQIDANKRKSWLVIAVFVAFMGAFGYFFSYIYGYDWSFMAFAILLSAVGSWVSYYNSDSIALSLAHAVPVTHKDAPAYVNIVENLSHVAQIPTPKTYVIESPALNAFATGRDPEHAAIAITRGCLETMTRTELEGVIGHELTHVKNYDTRLMAIVAVLAGSIAMAMNWAWRLSWFGGGRRRSDGEGGANGIIMLIGLVLVILAPIIAALIQMAISRRREYYADAGSAMLTRQPSGLIGALKKIAAHEDIPLETANTATAHMYIDNPLTTETHGSWMANMFSTHPPIADRIKALEQSM